MSAKGNKPSLKPVVYSKFDPKKLSFTELQKNSERSKSQMISFPRYKFDSGVESNFVFQTATVNITQYGLPRLGEYYKSDDARAFLKVPLDPSQPACVEMEKMLLSLDKTVLKNKEKVLAFLDKYIKLYKYQPIVREPVVNDDLAQIVDDDKKTEGEQKERCNYFKVKLDTEYQTGKINTLVFLKTKDSDGKVSREKIEIGTVTDLEQYISLGCSVRLVLMANKLWVAKNKDAAGDRKFGVTLKALQMEIEPRESSGSIRQDFGNYAFVDDDEEEKETTAAVEEENDEEDEEDEEEVEAEVEAEGDEEGDEEEDEGDEDEEEEDEDDEEVEADEDEEDEEEEDDEPEPEPEPEPVVIKKAVKKSDKKKTTKKATN